MPRLATHADHPHLYNPVVAASGYSNILAVIAGLALTAVVLVFTLYPTVENPSPAYRESLSFATSLFALAFIGCILLAFAFSSLTGEPWSVAAYTYSLYLASGVYTCTIGILFGLSALSHSVLPDASYAFLIAGATGAAVGQVFIVFAVWDIGRTSETVYGASSRTTYFRGVTIKLYVSGTAIVLAALAIRLAIGSHQVHRWEYVAAVVAGTVYVAGLSLRAVRTSTKYETHEVPSPTAIWSLVLLESFFVGFLIVVTP